MISTEKYLKFKQEFPLDSVTTAAARDNAFGLFTVQGLPSKKDEAWKYTSLTPLMKTELQLKTNEFSLTHEQLSEVKKNLKDNFINIVFVNGVLNKTLSDDFYDIAEVKEIEALDFKNSKAETEAKVVSLNRSQATEKLEVKIGSNLKDTTHLHILFFQTYYLSQLICPVVNIFVEEAASANIITNYMTSGYKPSSHVVNSDIHVTLAKNAVLNFINIQNQNLTDTYLSHVIFNLADGAQLKNIDLALGSGLSRHYIETQFTGMNAFAALYGAVCLSGLQHSDHYTYIHHLKGSNHSIQKYKTILAHQANSVFRGRIRIEPNAQKAQSEQVNNNLLLSREAQAQSVPQLEIYADDVKAAHGSTMGQMNPEELFYFLSRGINSIEATRMLSYGYILELTQLFDNEDMKNTVIKAVTEKLNGMIL
jgi:Fe-S cluster assembly protein SufD